MHKHTRIIAAFLAAIIFAGGVGVGYYLKPSSAPPLPFPTIFSSQEADPSLIGDVWTTLHEEYVDRGELDDTALIFGAVRGMIEALDDPFSVFFNPEETRAFLSSVNGTFEGIGAEIEVRDEKLLIVAPLRGTPAERAGLRPEDHIRAIDGDDTSGISVEEAVTKIRGKKGTRVILEIQRGDGDPFDVPIVRGTIHVPGLQWEIDEDGIATVSFFSFIQNASVDFALAAKALKDDSVRGIILDLRSNPGGFLNEAVDVAGILLPRNTLVLREMLGEGNERTYMASGSGALADVPIVVLVNEGSASASEILAGALRDQRDVTIVGKKTFGKGSVQAFEELSGGASFKYTIARWLTPSGSSIQDKGIGPDIEVDDNPDSEEDTQLLRAREALEKIVR